MDSQALKLFLSQPVNHEMLDRIVKDTLQVIPIKNSDMKLPSLKIFLVRLVAKSNIQPATLMATLCYLKTLKRKLPQNAQGLPCTRHRILLSCIIISSKFHNDSSPKNINWVKYSGNLFSLKDVNLMEKQFLFLLNYQVKVSTQELCSTLSKFLEPIKQKLIEVKRMEQFIRNERCKYSERRLSDSEASSILVPSSPESVMSMTRHDSVSSFSSMEIDPVIEFTAKREEWELSRFLDKVKRRELEPEKGIW